MLQIASDPGGTVFVAFNLYDASGGLVAKSNGFQRLKKALAVHCNAGELLLEIPGDTASPVQYRLYNASGQLLTWSDGAKTKIYPNLRMEGVGHGWTLPA